MTDQPQAGDWAPPEPMTRESLIAALEALPAGTKIAMETADDADPESTDLNWAHSVIVAEDGTAVIWPCLDYSGRLARLAAAEQCRVPCQVALTAVRPATEPGEIASWLASSGIGDQAGLITSVWTDTDGSTGPRRHRMAITSRVRLHPASDAMKVTAVLRAMPGVLRVRMDSLDYHILVTRQH